MLYTSGLLVMGKLKILIESGGTLHVNVCVAMPSYTVRHPQCESVVAHLHGAARQIA